MNGNDTAALVDEVLVILELFIRELRQMQVLNQEVRLIELSFGTSFRGIGALGLGPMF